MLTATATPPGDWDPSQKAVILSAVSSRLIVDAGPGTGKTAVACARLGHLVLAEDVRPSQTWMISFTRTAIAEIRARLHSYIGDAAFAVKVATVDAHAWAIHSGYDATASLTGSYEENIGRVLALVEGDDDVIDYLRNVEHLIVDEAQDLVGQRADLVEAIISRLDSSCGVTVFADEAQAIYGFSEDEDCSASKKPEELLERLRSNPAYRFDAAALDTIHRTSAKGLRSIFSEVRTAVLGGRGDGDGLFARIRQSIANYADGDDLKPTELGLDTLAAGSLVLFRTRPEALLTSQFCQIPHSLRLSGYGGNLPPWLAICFHDWLQTFMARDEFMGRWASRVEHGSPPGYGPDEAWAKLVRLGGSADGSLEMARLRRALARRSAPVELATAEFGLPGPVIGTIHASKGREADSVLLLASDDREFKSVEDEEEETRVLFVGSTRARLSLKVGKAIKYPGSTRVDSIPLIRWHVVRSRGCTPSSGSCRRTAVAAFPPSS
ncbi:UvrD-helicase domain-containing protein [Novosphingobium sp. CF614]|uniref:UvrD-helicase domain-containing protein n=1 Tax=Novosphingobium sp. CF614 TaxID=1884364 RepID=UPI001160AC92|nr:UvrD-helicase domain-containing protein [Novosphingobium sp. CF614]